MKPEDIVQNPVQAITWAAFLDEVKETPELGADIRKSLRENRNVIVVMLKNENRIGYPLSHDFPAVAIHLTQQNNPHPQFRLASDLRVPIIAYVGWKSTDSFDNPSACSMIRVEQ